MRKGTFSIKVQKPVFQKDAPLFVSAENDEFSPFFENRDSEVGRYYLEILGHRDKAYFRAHLNGSLLSIDGIDNKSDW